MFLSMSKCSGYEPSSDQEELRGTGSTQKLFQVLLESV